MGNLTVLTSVDGLAKRDMNFSPETANFVNECLEEGILASCRSGLKWRQTVLDVLDKLPDRQGFRRSALLPVRMSG